MENPIIIGAKNSMQESIAVIIPCFNEGGTISAVVSKFRLALPDARVYVFDNNSTDDTSAVARTAGAIVFAEPRQGKGNVVRRMFADVQADVYVLVDGDDTYDAASAQKLVSVLTQERHDMVVGTRVPVDKGSYRRGHAIGNRMITGMVRWIFGRRVTDMLSGYRVLSRRFVKSFPALSSGFEIETELTVHALELGIPFCEIPTPYYERPSGSKSKLSTFRDGWRIIATIVKLVKGERPLAFFGWIGVLLAAVSIFIAIPLWITFMETGLVPRLPTAVLATGLMLLAFLGFVCGLVLDIVTKGRQEMKRLAYLRFPASPAAPEATD